MEQVFSQLLTNLDGFCDDTFWLCSCLQKHRNTDNIDLTWYGKWPQFTECFRNTVLVWLPCGFLWLSAPFYTSYLATCPPTASGRSFSQLLLFKLAFLCLLLILSILDIANIISHKTDTHTSLLKADVFAPVLVTSTLFLSGCFMVAERRKRFVTSGVLFIFWLLLLMCSAVTFYTYIKLQIYEEDVFRFTTFYLQFFFFLVELSLHCRAEAPTVTHYTLKKPSPEIAASFPSRLSFWWLNNLMRQGYRQPLTEASMPDLHPRDKCETVVPGFLKNWGMTLSSWKLRTKTDVSSSAVGLVHGNEELSVQEVEESSSLLSARRDCPPQGPGFGEKKGSGPSFSWVLFTTFWKEYLLSQIWKLLYDFLNLSNPLILGMLVDYVQTPNSEDWNGYVLAATLFISTLLQSVLFHQVFHCSTCLGIHIRASIISSVFRKALTMDNLARKESTVGEVVNLMSVDAEHIESMMSYLWAIWSSPLQIILSLYLLYTYIGVSMFAGASFLVLLIPANGYITAKLADLQGKLMELKDDRMKVMNELLSGIKIIKLFAWERSFEKRILEIREKELLTLRKSAILSSVLTFSWTVAPFLVSLLTFLCYVYIAENHYLDPKTAFVAISLFDILRYAINFAPMIVTDLLKAVVSARRIGHFLCHDDLDKDSVTHDENLQHAITIENGNFCWSSHMGLTLKNINITVEEGSLVAIVGSVGSGKSSLLSAMLGEMEKRRGTVTMRGTVAYVSQQAWIQNASVRNNILFGKSMNQELYDRCIDACALAPDLEMLPAGDRTEIGERGINLSGGQKQRVSLARAVYAQADIYLLDDPLSAVDSHVGQHIFDQVIGQSGLLDGKVRILVTHGIQYLAYTDHIIVIASGEVSEAGHYEQLLSHKGAFAKLITTFLAQADEEDKAHTEEFQELKQEVLKRLSETEEDGNPTGSLLPNSQDIFRQLSYTVTHIIENTEPLRDEKPVVPFLHQSSQQSTLIEEEGVEIGDVKFSIYQQYAKSVGYCSVIMIILLYAVYQASSMAALIFLSFWTDDDDLGNFTKWPDNSTDRRARNDYYVSLYGLFGFLQTVFIIGFSMIESLRAVHASRILHSSMLGQILRAPMSFFDTTPVGRIINRFSKDIDDVDNEIPLTFLMWLDCVFTVAATIIVISYSTPIFLAFLLPMAGLYYFVQRFYIATSRQLKRLGSKSRSPIFNHFSETLSGASVVRAFNAESRFVLESDARVDTNHIFMFTNYSCNRWLGFRLETVGNLILLLAATIAVATKDSISGGIIGLSITYALTVTENLNWLVRMTSDLETQIVSVERIIEYTQVNTEADWDSCLYKSPLGWPHSGHVKVDALSVRYRDGLDLVLKKISFQVKPGEKVGIVGRTGAGKSSLALALFRLLEPASGSILIDGVDISLLGLHDLRSKITILPQDPVLFAGTLRENLDPFEEHSEAALWQALDHAYLRTFIDTLPDQLAHQCGEGGGNLSVGQRQLLCLARALLRKTKILVLDEATAAVDMETDELIQETIRKEFCDCTILTIAHRMNTVMDYDRILVLEKGEVKEFDTPRALLQKPNGLFLSMAKTAGLIA